jgi:hypothetical protein
MLLVGLATPDAALYVRTPADDKQGMARAAGLVIAVATAVLHAPAPPAPLNTSPVVQPVAFCG